MSAFLYEVGTNVTLNSDIAAPTVNPLDFLNGAGMVKISAGTALQVNGVRKRSGITEYRFDGTIGNKPIWIWIEESQLSPILQSYVKHL